MENTSKYVNKYLHIDFVSMCVCIWDVIIPRFSLYKSFEKKFANITKFISLTIYTTISKIKLRN